MRPRVMVFVREFPQISQTYIKNEVETLARDHEVAIVSLAPANVAEPEHLPYRMLTTFPDMLAAIREFKPQVLHCHYMLLVNIVAKLAQESGLRFTVRTHSFDIMESAGNYGNQDWQQARANVQSEACLAVLAFPFLRPTLLDFGVPAEKLVDVPPVVDFQRFLDRGPNGHAIMNMGAVRPKKKMEDFVELSRMLPGREFNLYAMGYKVDALKAYSEQRNGPLNFIPPIPHAQMPAEYKKHEWLVYTAHSDIRSVGWPMAVAEAQAAGVGVCLAGLRPDMREYVGESGHLFTDLESVRELIGAPPTPAMREAGFEQARKSDIRVAISLLTDRWQPVL